MNQYHLKENKMFYENWKVLHKEKVDDVLTQFYDHLIVAYQNEKTMLQYIKKRYVWPRMVNDI